MADLITSAYAQQAIEAGGNTLTSAQSTFLASAITAASRAVEKFCGGRVFTQTNHVERHRVDWTGAVGLKQWPVNAVTRIECSPIDALEIQNADTSTNQRARVAFAFTGDHDSGLTLTGLTLTRVASGVTNTVSSVTFNTYTTLDTVSGAIVAAANGWTCSRVNDEGNIASADLIWQDVGPFDALDPSKATLQIFEVEIDGELDRDTGMLYLPDAISDDVRVTYSAGFSTIPADVQTATAEVTWLMLSRVGGTSGITSERIGDYSYTMAADAAVQALPESVRQVLASYRRYVI